MITDWGLQGFLSSAPHYQRISHLPKRHTHLFWDNTANHHPLARQPNQPFPSETTGPQLGGSLLLWRKKERTSGVPVPHFNWIENPVLLGPILSRIFLILVLVLKIRLSSDLVLINLDHSPMINCGLTSMLNLSSSHFFCFQNTFYFGFSSNLHTINRTGNPVLGLCF